VAPCQVDGQLEIVQIDNRAAGLRTLAQAGAAYLLGSKNMALGLAIGT
jgi:hypothetical protein